MKLYSDVYEQYKKSEGEWADTVPSEWHEKRVKDLFKMVTQIAPVDNDHELLSLYASIGVRPRKELEARGNKASSTDGYWMVKKNDIVVNKLLAWMGAVGLSEYDGVTSPAYDVLRQVKSDIDPRYFAYLFRTETAKKIFRKNSRGIMDMRLRLYFDKLGAITVPVPSIIEQRKIADYTDKKTVQIDRKIKLLESKMELYDKLRQTIIDDAAITGIDKKVSLRTTEIEWLGDIPSHWECQHFKRFSTMKGRIGWQGLKHSEFIDEGPFLITGMNFKGGNIKWEEVYHISTERYEQAPEIQLKCGDILMTKDGTIGKLLFVDDIPHPGTASLNSHLLVFRPISNSYFTKYLYYQLQTSAFKHYVDLVKAGTTFFGISQAAVGRYVGVLPPINEQKAIAEYLDVRIEQIEKIENLIIEQIDKLKELRIALIYDVVTGRTKITEEKNSKENAA